MSTVTSYDGTRIAYEVEGSGPPVLLVPGGPRASRYLEDLGGLAADFSLIRFDARGTGASDASSDTAGYAFPALARDVEALRAHLGHERLAILGHSAGVAVTQAFAVAHPERVERLVLVTPGPQVVGLGGDDIPGILAARATEPWHADTEAAFSELFALGPDADPQSVLTLLERVTPAAYGAWDERQRSHAAGQRADFGLQAWAHFFATDQGPAILAALSRVDSPVLVVTGDRDGLAGVATGRELAARYPRGRHVSLATAGHYPWVDDAPAFVTAVGAFLRGQSDADDRVRDEAAAAR